MSAPCKSMFSPALFYRSSFNPADSRNAEWRSNSLKTLKKAPNSKEHLFFENNVLENFPT